MARKFAAAYPVVLLARNPDNFESLAKEINSSGGKAIGISTDVSDSKSVKNAVETIKKEFGSDVGAAVSVTLVAYLQLPIVFNRLPSSTPVVGFSESPSSSFPRKFSPNLSMSVRKVAFFSLRPRFHSS